MTAIEKYNEEKQDVKSQRKIRILSSAFDLFSEKGIDFIAITDIAKKAEIGVASIYRYYETKDQIAINTAVWAWNERSTRLLPVISGEAFENKTGFEKLRTIFEVFNDLFEEDRAFLRFIYFFDSYVFRQDITKENFDDYEESIKFIQDKILDSIDKGIEDKTIKCPEGFTDRELYYTIMHSLFSMVQKLSLSENLLSMNAEVSAQKQIKLLKEMLLNSIKA